MTILTCADGEQAKKRFGFLKEERKYSDSSVVRGQISGLSRLVSKLSDIKCRCLALNVAVTARAGHFIDSVRKNLAAP